MDSDADVDREKNLNPVYTYSTKMYRLGYKMRFVQYGASQICRL